LPRILTVVLALSAGLLPAACACNRCAVESLDGVDVSVLSSPTAAERGAIASALALVTVEAGPESSEVRAIDHALGSRRLLIGWFHRAEDGSAVRGYALLRDGRVVLDHEFVRAATADSGYLADPRSWPFVPFLYAAGRRIAAGGSWESSVEAAGSFAGSLAETVEAGRADGVLPVGTDDVALALALKRWRADL